MSVTIRDVAKLANVSTKTVSRVINDQGEIRQATRQRVQAAIEELGYYPNILARSLVSGRSNTLAVVTFGLEYYGPSQAVVGIERKADELGYSLLLSLVSRPDDYNVNAVLAALVARLVDGIIWAIPEIGSNHSWIDSNRLDNLPPIVFLSMAPRPGLPVATVDNRLGARLATQHLIDLGRKRIGLITGPLDWWEARERHEGWAETSLEAGLPVSPASIVEGDWSAASGERGLRELLAQQAELDAVFVSNDQMALGVLRAAQKLGRRVPQDLAVVGFDDIPESGFFCPPLTTVHQSLTDIAAVAVQELQKSIQSQQNGSKVEFTTTMLVPELVIRASSVGE
ncbi:MAG: LacI family DNA-binding transcriptional regulator [Thermoflexales bacterium]|nr:LacI family DNA-binding transcriptional regulator [Thermoflexales bacterium]